MLWLAAAAVLGALLILLGVDRWFQQHYALIGRWPWYAGPVRWHDLPASVWGGGSEMRAYRRLDAP